MNKKTIRDIDLAGKRVLVRVDFNVPLDSAGCSRHLDVAPWQTRWKSRRHLQTGTRGAALE